MSSPTTGNSWSNTNLAQAATWFLLATFEDLTTGFSAAKDVKMSALAFFNPAVSSDMLESLARQSAANLDIGYRTTFGATFQNNWDIPKSVDAMTLIMKVGDKTVEDLATQVDMIYKF
jgi:hypothetical protein